MMKSQIALLLTGTVNPKNMIFTKLQDSEIRKNQYIESLKFWISSTTSIPIIFVENSGVDLTEYLPAEIKSNRLEILNFEGNNYPVHLGKGFGELACFEFAYKNSKYLQKADFIFKVTGRHKVLNFDTFFDYYLKCPKINIMVDFQSSLKFCDSRFFGFIPSFIYNYLLKFKPVLNDSENIYFEHVLAKAALIAISDDYIFSPMVTYPRIQGMSGTSGEVYDGSYETWLAYSEVYECKCLLFTTDQQV